MHLWRLIVGGIKGSLGAFVVVVIFQFAQAILSLLIPTINAEVINNGVMKGDTGTIWRLGGLMLAVGLGQVVANAIAVLAAARLAMKSGRDLRLRVFERVSDFSERDVQQFGAASLITRNTNDVQQVQMFILLGCTVLVSAPMLAIGGMVMAWRANAELSRLAWIAVPLMVLSMGLIVSRMVPIFVLMQERLDRLNQVVREQLTGIRVVRAFVQERAERERFRVANDGITDASLRTGNLFVLAFPLVSFILNVASVAVLWFAAPMINRGTLEIGTMMAFLQYLMQILSGVLMATFLTITVPRAAVGARRIAEVLQTEPSLDPSTATLTTQPTPGRVQFRNVTFTYPGASAPVLNDVSFLVEPGETVAIVGSTGAGKTTLINLVLRLFDVTSGAVEVGGIDVRDTAPDKLWTSLGAVPQRPYLFRGTIASNLRVGSAEASDAELWQALQTAQAADFVRAKSEGLDARITQGGTNVSGGQRQRLAIARAILKRAPIMIFDDSFSALDLATDARLRAALQSDLGEVTKLVVAQRVSSIVSADRIVVLEAGSVVGLGTHQELLESSNTYREIVDSQLAVEV